MSERMLDKRKARDKETDDEGGDTSLNKNPMKRARVEYSNNSSSSPKEKSPSPGSAQKSPLKSASVADPFAAATPAPIENESIKPEKSSEGSNGEVVETVEPVSVPKTNGSGDEQKIKFDLPKPLTSKELEQKIGKNSNNENTEDSDSDGGTKFLEKVIQSEENKKRKGSKGGSGVSSGSGSEGSRNGTGKRGSTTGKSQGKGPQPVRTSSPVSDQSTVVNGNMEVQVCLSLINPVTRATLAEETVFISDVATVESFLKKHDKQLVLNSSQSQGSSAGYMGDVSSMDTLASLASTKSSNSSNSNPRWTISSLGSTIPRQSIVSIMTNDSDSPEDTMKRPGKPVSKARKRSDGPIMSSTKCDDTTGTLDKMNVSGNSLSNGDDVTMSTVSSAKGSRKSSQSPQQNPSPTKKSKATPSSRLLQDKDEGLGTPSTPSTSNSTRKSKATPGASDSGLGNKSTGGKKPAPRRRVGSASNFPITTPVVIPVLNTPPPARSVAKIEGTTAKPMSQFEKDMNNEPVVESELQKGATLWSAILPEELVFARWRDRSYYSGMVKSKGLNDTWIIDFDDGMEDVASESHIVPIRILGVGIKGIYSPDEKYDAKQAEVIGQKFLTDPGTGLQAVKYAIKINGGDKPIWCSRRQLSIKETDAKKLRSEYQAPVAPKAGDVSLDNIVSGPRRRTRGAANDSETSSNPDTKLVAGAFDASSADDMLEAKSAASTPKGKPGPKGKKTPASEAKKKRSGSTTSATTSATASSSTSSNKEKEAGTTKPEKSPAKEKESEKKESPGKKDGPVKKEVVLKKNSVIEFGKKKTKKTLFQGIQFFLTASGGGDPGISGNPDCPPEAYDKDEVREQIESCGGEIIDIVGEETADDVFLISDSYARTVKYIYCLAAGLPCLSHSWINRCLELNEIVEWSVFVLPAGWSLEHQDLIAAHIKKPLEGCKVFVTSESDQLYNYWKPVLTAAKAHLLKPPRKKGTIIPAGAEVVVTDNHSDSTPDLIREAKELNLPLVKPEWLVQTIIMGEKAHLYGHNKYKILFNEESEEVTGGGSESQEESKENINEALANQETPD